MVKMQFIKKLDYYLGPCNEYANFNIGIYDELYQQTDITELFRPVEFFEKAYEEYLFFYHHSANYLEIVEHFKALPFDGDRLYYILYYLSNLLVISYADKESRGIIFRHDDIVLRGVAYIKQLFEKIKKDKDWENRFVPKHGQKLKNWQYPAWDKNDFIQNNASYRHILTTYSYTEDDFIVEERPYYDIKKGSLICARLLPLEYLSLLAYEIHIPKARREPDLQERILLFRKIKSDIQTTAVDLTTTNDIGKKHKRYFDISEISQHIDVYIENVESSLALKASNSHSQANPIPTSNGLDFKKELETLRGTTNLFWKGLPMSAVVDHFTLFNEKKNRNGDHYLTPQQLISFLKKGFLKDKTQPIQKINCAAGEKGLVIKHFYGLYDLAVAKYGHPARKKSFITMFTECFDNWESATIDTFFKSNKVKDSL